jgi:hypothetical protein
MHVEPAGARTAAQVLVRPADGEIDVERLEVDRHRTGRVVDVAEHFAAALDRAHVAPISVRTSSSSGKKLSPTRLRRYSTPAVPPVPRLKPMMRSTVFT